MSLAATEEFIMSGTYEHARGIPAVEHTESLHRTRGRVSAHGRRFGYKSRIAGAGNPGRSMAHEQRKAAAIRLSTESDGRAFRSRAAPGQRAAHVLRRSRNGRTGETQ